MWNSHLYILASLDALREAWQADLNLQITDTERLMYGMQHHLSRAEPKKFNQDVAAESHICVQLGSASVRSLNFKASANIYAQASLQQRRANISMSPASEFSMTPTMRTLFRRPASSR